MPSITITLPLPHKLLNPNRPGHWSRKSALKKQARLEAGVAAIAAMNELGIERPRWAKATVLCRFYYRTRARHDADNSMASMKSVMDGFTDAKVWIDDSGVSPLPPVIGYDKNDPRVEVEITQIG